MNDKRHQVFLFDLGGVLVEFNGIEPLVRLTGGRLDVEGARRFWLVSPWVRTFEKGGCTAEAFAEGIIGELVLDVSAEEFLRQFLSWEKGPFDGASGLLNSLKARFKLACLSNNNVLHWNLLRDGLGFGNPFDRSYLSHEIGMVKPDPDIFQYVIEDLGVPAGEILYFDDNPECVAGAAEAGMDAELVSGVGDVRKSVERRYPGFFIGDRL
jgi:putative hydrolase of the HAD superfamily